MALLLFKAGEPRQRSKICDFLNEFGHIPGGKFMGNAESNAYYGINTETLRTCCGSIDYLQSHYPTIEKKIYDTIPTFIKIPVYIQKKMVENSISGNPIPFIDDIFANASKGGIDWNRISSADYAEIMSAITANTDLEFKVIDTPLANTALADISVRADVNRSSLSPTNNSNFDFDIKIDTSSIDTGSELVKMADKLNNKLKAIDDYYNNKSLNNETELQNKENPLRGDSREIKGGICCRKHKPRVAIKPLGYKKVIGRG